MDVLSRSVAVAKHLRYSKFVIPFVFGLAFLSLFFQTGNARGKIFSSLPSNSNSPENSLRGIGFNPETSLSSGTPDAYGYQWDDTVVFDWKDPTGAVSVTLSSEDDGFAGPIPLGFSFPFYENTFTQTYVSANGYISFDPIIGFDAQNQEIPYESSPNNLIAPFWADLAIGGNYNDGILSTLQGSDGNGNYFLVNYLNVAKRIAPNDLLSFQVILYENGDIWFQYQTLMGDLSASVGIEDGDGLIGSSYSLPLISNLALRFQRPSPAARVKLLSNLQSGLTESGLREFVVKIRNTGELGADTYELTTIYDGVGNPNWAINLYNAQGVPLNDTNSNGNLDTGAVDQGTTATILVHLVAPPGNIVGDHTSFKLTATSSLDSGEAADVRFLSAVPSRHVIAFGNSAGLDMGRITKDRQIIFDVTDFGDYPSVIMADGLYFNVWEDADFNPGTDIEYAVMNYYGNPVKPSTKLTSNADSSYLVRDYAPFLAFSADKRVGVVWVRRLIDPENPYQGENFNIFLAILNPRGQLLFGPTNITNNGPDGPCEANPEICWYNDANYDVPSFSSPAIMATPDNRFIISWVDTRKFETGDSTNIGYEIFDTEGNSLRPLSSLKTGVIGGNRFDGLHLTQLPNERMLVGYTTFNPFLNEHIPGFDVYSTSSTVSDPMIQENILMNGTQGRNLVTEIVNSSKILMAWTSIPDEQTEYTLLSDNGYIVSSNNNYTSILTPDGRAGDFISAAANADQECILTWVDTDIGNRIYYALIGANGNLITPAMIAWEDNETIIVSQTGQGVVYIPDWLVGLPIIQR